MESFEGNLDKITEIQTSFFEEAEDFVYFRKGEFENIIEILEFVTNYVKNNPDIILVVVAAYPEAKKLATDIFSTLKKGIGRIGRFVADEKEKNELTFRIISKEAGHTKELDEFEKKGAGVCIIPDEEGGRIRYFINEKRFCFFVRSYEDQNKFFGIIDDDKLMIQRFKKLFEYEFYKHSKI